LPLRRDAEEGNARMTAALNASAAVAYIARSDGNDLRLILILITWPQPARLAVQGRCG
jgi:hypothetical protein